MQRDGLQQTPVAPVERKETGRSIFVKRRHLLQYMGIGAAALGVGLAGVPALASSPDKAPDFISLLRSRRSVREYTGEPVSREDLQSILAAGMSAPSAQNCRPWHFVILTPGKSLGWIDRIIPMTAYTAKAGAAILVCTDTSVEPGQEMAIVSTACCVQNMLLASHSLGYGSVWVNIYPTQEYVDAWRETAGLPRHMLPLCVLPVGRPAAPPPPVDRTDSGRIHYESW